MSRLSFEAHRMRKQAFSLSPIFDNRFEETRLEGLVPRQQESRRTATLSP